MGRPPQGHPVVVQAGSSDAGLDLAAHSADVVFTSHPSIESALPFYRDLKARVVAAGRDPQALRILTAIQPIVADTMSEADAIARELDALIDPALAIAMLEMQFAGLDLSSYDPDEPLPPIPANNASQGSQKHIVEQAARENLSLLQIARKVAAGRTSRTVNGTAEQVADLLAEWFAEGAADGFVITAPILPDMLARFVDRVVPLLQARGLFRIGYSGSTLRDHLGLPRPSKPYDSRTAHRDPSFWQIVRN